jgi:hypothetical protein|tara:strand:+ start:4101 stop:4256 length:156 start_codon:yes stop_codon:yes gene_type:complete
MELGIRVERDYKGVIHQLEVKNETTQAEVDAFYEALKESVEPKKPISKKSK